MTCLGPYEMFYFFSPYVYCYQILCLIIWMHTNNFYLFLQQPYEMFFPLRNSVLCIKFYWLSDEGIKHWLNGIYY